MKIIISRKGFDWSNGHTPSPVMPDGTLLSMPIPSYDYDTLSELHYKTKSYASIMEELKPSERFRGMSVHLDPDIRRNNRDKLPEGWVPAFGQIDTAQRHLENQGVKEGDLFLFFGWFGLTQEKNGQLKYISAQKDLHIIWGYLQIGKIVKGNECEEYYWHPHSGFCGNNTIYAASEKLIIDRVDTGLPGAGCLKYSKDVVLTKEGETRSRWLLPDFFKEVDISFHTKDCFKPEGYFQTVRIGQEFVVSEDDRVTNWAKNLIVNNYDKEASELNNYEFAAEKERKKEIKKQAKAKKELERKTEIRFLQKEVTEVNADAIVCPANPFLRKSSGVSAEIFNKAGEWELKEECAKFGKVEYGSAVITPGLKLCKHIIHAVVPKSNGLANLEFFQLINIYISSLNLAKENRCKTIVFPLLTIEGMPREVNFWEAAISFCERWIEENEEYTIRIIFADPDEDVIKAGRKTFQKQKKSAA